MKQQAYHSHFSNSDVYNVLEQHLKQTQTHQVWRVKKKPSERIVDTKPIHFHSVERKKNKISHGVNNCTACNKSNESVLQKPNYMYSTKQLIDLSQRKICDSYCIMNGFVPNTKKIPAFQWISKTINKIGPTFKWVPKISDIKGPILKWVPKTT